MIERMLMLLLFLAGVLLEVEGASIKILSGSSPISVKVIDNAASGTQKFRTYALSPIIKTNSNSQAFRYVYALAHPPTKQSNPAPLSARPGRSHLYPAEEPADDSYPAHNYNGGSNTGSSYYTSQVVHRPSYSYSAIAPSDSLYGIEDEKDAYKESDEGYSKGTDCPDNAKISDSTPAPVTSSSMATILSTYVGEDADDGYKSSSPSYDDNKVETSTIYNDPFADLDGYTTSSSSSSSYDSDDYKSNQEHEIVHTTDSSYSSESSYKESNGNTQFSYSFQTNHAPTSHSSYGETDYGKSHETNHGNRHGKGHESDYGKDSHTDSHDEHNNVKFSYSVATNHAPSSSYSSGGSYGGHESSTQHSSGNSYGGEDHAPSSSYSSGDSYSNHESSTHHSAGNSYGTENHDTKSTYNVHQKPSYGGSDSYEHKETGYVPGNSASYGNDHEEHNSMKFNYQVQTNHAPSYSNGYSYSSSSVNHAGYGANSHHQPSSYNSGNNYGNHDSSKHYSSGDEYKSTKHTNYAPSSYSSSGSSGSYNGYGNGNSHHSSSKPSNSYETGGNDGYGKSHFKYIVQSSHPTYTSGYSTNENYKGSDYTQHTPMKFSYVVQTNHAAPYHNSGGYTNHGSSSVGGYSGGSSHGAGYEGSSSHSAGYGGSSSHGTSYGGNSGHSSSHGGSHSYGETSGYDSDYKGSAGHGASYSSSSPYSTSYGSDDSKYEKPVVSTESYISSTESYIPVTEVPSVHLSSGSNAYPAEEEKHEELYSSSNPGYSKHNTEYVKSSSSSSNKDTHYSYSVQSQHGQHSQSSHMSFGNSPHGGYDNHDSHDNHNSYDNHDNHDNHNSYDNHNNYNNQNNYNSSKSTGYVPSYPNDGGYSVSYQSNGYNSGSDYGHESGSKEHSSDYKETSSYGGSYMPASTYSVVHHGSGGNYHNGAKDHYNIHYTDSISTNPNGDCDNRDVDFNYNVRNNQGHYMVASHITHRPYYVQSHGGGYSSDHSGSSYNNGGEYKVHYNIQTHDNKGYGSESSGHDNHQTHHSEGYGKHSYEHNSHLELSTVSSASYGEDSDGYKETSHGGDYKESHSDNYGPGGKVHFNYEVATSHKDYGQSEHGSEQDHEVGNKPSVYKPPQTYSSSHIELAKPESHDSYSHSNKHTSYGESESYSSSQDYKKPETYHVQVSKPVETHVTYEVKPYDSQSGKNEHGTGNSYQSTVSDNGYSLFTNYGNNGHAFVQSNMGYGSSSGHHGSSSHGAYSTQVKENNHHSSYGGGDQSQGTYQNHGTSEYYVEPVKPVHVTMEHGNSGYHQDSAQSSGYGGASYNGYKLNGHSTHVMMPMTSFSCKTHDKPGFYADTEAQCKVWHYCQVDGRQDSFMCPTGTLFNQASLTCDWWFNVKCHDSRQYDYVNDALYKNFGQGGSYSVPYNNGGYSKWTMSSHSFQPTTYKKRSVHKEVPTIVAVITES